MLLSEEALDAVDLGFDELVDEVDERKLALRDCIEQLPANWREIVQMRYWRSLSVTVVAAQLSRSANAVSVTLNRIPRAPLR